MINTGPSNLFFIITFKIFQFKEYMCFLLYSFKKLVDEHHPSDLLAYDEYLELKKLTGGPKSTTSLVRQEIMNLRGQVHSETQREMSLRESFENQVGYDDLVLINQYINFSIIILIAD